MRSSLLIPSMVLVLGACPPAVLDPIVTASEASTGSTAPSEATGVGTAGVSSTPTSTGGPDDPGGTSTTGTAGETTGHHLPLDFGQPEPDMLTCAIAGTCNQLDLLLVIDNSGSMAEEQQNLAAQFTKLVARLRTLQDGQGQAVGADVNVMVTTTDVGHPLCSPFEKPDYVPAAGAPISTPCTERLERFNGLDNFTKLPGACTANCLEGAVARPSDPFIHFDLQGDNIIDDDELGDPVADALACVAPQGIDGCGMEAPLEAMLRALDPGATWNTGDKPFLRPGGVLAVVLMTDETDCSVEDFAYFDPGNVNDPEFNKYWPDNPQNPGTKKDPTSAVCWNASMTCEDADVDGTYESCVAEDKEPLFPRARYTDTLQDVFEAAGKPVFMLVLTGVPSVTEHDPIAPHGPIAGGFADLVHRQWKAADILPADVESGKDAAAKEYDFGIGPGCTNAATGQALPPGRIADVCASLDRQDDPNMPGDQAELRCCIESICDDDFGGAVDCLADMLAQRLTAD